MLAMSAFFPLGVKMERDEITELLKKLVEYEVECIKHQPQRLNKLRVRVNYNACKECPLNKEGEFCRLGEVREKLQELFLSGKVPKIFEQLIFGIDIERLVR